MRLVWFKRVWRCVEPLCGNRTWSERHEAIAPRAVLTERARAECARRVGQDATDVARVAYDLGVGWGTVMRAVREYGQKILDQQWLATNVTALGLDETAFLAATPICHTRFVTGLVDLAPAGGGPARLLDVVEGRCGKVVTDWLTERGPAWCSRVQVAALDPFRGYDTALRAGLPEATVVLDAFHAVRLAQAAVDDVRRRVQQDTRGHRGRKDLGTASTEVCSTTPTSGPTTGTTPTMEATPRAESARVPACRRRRSPASPHPRTS